MKKVYALLAVLVLNIIAASAQETPSTMSTKWGVGLRAGGSMELVGRYDGLGVVAGKPMYLEAHLGVNLPYFYPEGTAIAAWNLLQFGESQVGGFTFDLGLAANAGGISPKSWWVGVGPMVKLDYTFNKAPITLAIDYTPIAAMSYGFATCGATGPMFFPSGLFNAAFSCTYNF